MCIRLNRTYIESFIKENQHKLSNSDTFWWQIRSKFWYIIRKEFTKANFSIGICPSCNFYHMIYPDTVSGKTKYMNGSKAYENAFCSIRLIHFPFCHVIGNGRTGHTAKQYKSPIWYMVVWIKQEVSRNHNWM